MDAPVAAGAVPLLGRAFAVVLTHAVGRWGFALCRCRGFLLIQPAHHI